MNIRPDLQAVEPLLYRLLEYAKVFQNNNREHWPHLKNGEDFRNVYELPWAQRGPLEAIYGDGRDLAVFMGSRLTEFNYAELFPTLKSFSDSFNGGWIDQVDLLRETSQLAKDKLSELDQPPWAARQMVKLFDDQIELLKSIKPVIQELKNSDVYKWENNSTLNQIYTTEYEKILNCIHLIGRMFERLPSTYAKKEEEHLRDHILITLGAAIIGSTTGETFNKRGKTDILVRGHGGNEFVGECKFWRGNETYQAAITQLLSYLSWRDNKAAIILFVPNKEFSSVLEKIRTNTPSHPNFLRQVSEQEDTWLSYEFRSNEDPDRIVNVAVMAYHIPEVV